MELVYVWIENNKNIKNQGFNFSSNYDISEKISYDFTKGDNEKEILVEPRVTINVKPKQNVYKKLYGENIVNITAIIGENGTGKTNILKIIRDEISKNSYNKYIFNDKYYSDTKDNLITFETSRKNKTVCIDQNKLEPSDFKDERTVVYYDNIFQTQYNQPSTYTGDRELIDISTGKLYNELRDKYDSNEIKNQMIFIKSEEAYEVKKKLPELTLPKEFSFSNITDFFLQGSLQVEEEYKEFLKIEEKVKKEIKGELDNASDTINNEYFKESFIFYFQITILKIAIISTQKEGFENSSDIVNKFIDIFSDFNKKITEFENNNSQKYTSLSAKGIRKENIGFPNGDYGAKRSQLIKSLLNFKKWNEEIERILRNLKLNRNLKITYDKNLYFLKNQEPQNFYFNKLELGLEKNGEALNKLMNINKENSVEFHFFEYRWLELSSGEKAILSLFSRFYSKKDEISNDFILILLDEPELYFHPEWQRKFIKMFVKFINEIFKDKKVQIVMTSHSPFVASDLPKENVIMLGKYKEDDKETKTEDYNHKFQKVGNCKVKPRDINTFGANIFDLYSKAFFVESSFGEFAKEKIQDIAEKIKEKKYDENKEEIDYIVDSIGEKLVKTKLLNMIKENQSKEDRISELEKELARLRGENK